MPLDLSLLDERLAEAVAEEVGDTPEQEPGGWIANGSERWPGTDPAAQGGRAEHCMARIVAANEVAEIEGGAIAYRIEALQQQVREAEDRLQQVETWRADRTRWYRTALVTWARTCEALQRAKAKHINLGSGRLGVRRRKATTAIEWGEDAEIVKALQGKLPDDCFAVKPCKGAIKAHLVIEGGKVAVGDGSDVPPEAARVKVLDATDTHYIQVGATKFDLELEEDTYGPADRNGNGDSTLGGATADARTGGSLGADDYFADGDANGNDTGDATG